jgi:beta-1,2-mannosyltransferase
MTRISRSPTLWSEHGLGCQVSSVWLPEQRMFLVVTRIVFLGEKQILSAPKASFLRGQIFNEIWEYQENYNVTMNGETLTFLLVFDIPTKYEGGKGEYYGPEDPRIILEDNVPGAEPVIIFNMAHERSDWK